MATLKSPAVLIHRHGGPEVLEVTEMDVPDPGPQEVRIRQQAIGLNFADIYQRRGAHGPHQTTQFPVVLGSQGSGVIESVGADVHDLKVGQAVTYVHPGAYAAVRLLPAERTLPMPDGLDMESAAATLLRGMTAEYLLHRLYRLQAGERVLVHAAAGGMGLILSAWARALGAEVIGTVGSDAKRETALAHGCHAVINYKREDFVRRVGEITGGQGVSIIYDAVGRDVFFPSLDCLANRGTIISYGTASGDVEGLDLHLLHPKSLTVCRPTLKSFIATTAELRQSAATFAAAVKSGAVRAEIGRRYRLSEIVRAHEELENRQTTGAPVLLP